MKIVFFGDSLTEATIGVSFVDKVAAAMPGHRFINEGVNGDTSLNLLRRVDNDVLKHKPDGVFVMIGVNDAVSYVEPVSRPYYRFVKRIPRGQSAPISFRENMRAIFNKLLYAQVNIWVALPPVEYRPEVVSALRLMNDHAAEVCKELQIPTLDLLSRLVPAVVPARPQMGIGQYQENLLTVLGVKRYDQRRAAGGYAYSFDGVHLTNEGANRIADAVVPFLRANGVS
jgi:lysophospholipase L1-like esterase